MENSMNIKNRVAIWPSNFISGYLPKENKNQTNFKIYVHLYVNRSLIYNNQDMEAT